MLFLHQHMHQWLHLLLQRICITHFIHQQIQIRLIILVVMVRYLIFDIIKIYLSILEIKRERLDPKITAKLEGIDLWKQFYSLGNEMIITKYVKNHFSSSIFY